MDLTGLRKALERQRLSRIAAGRKIVDSLGTPSCTRFDEDGNEYGYWLLDDGSVLRLRNTKSGWNWDSRFVFEASEMRAIASLLASR